MKESSIPIPAKKTRCKTSQKMSGESSVKKNAEQKQKQKLSKPRKPAMQSETLDTSLTFQLLNFEQSRSLNDRDIAKNPNQSNSTSPVSNNYWIHPNLLVSTLKKKTLDPEQMNELIDFYFERFLSFFTDQPEGSISGPVKIELSRRMAQKLGLSYLFERIIRLNLKYFTISPSLLPYTLFHEMTHLWLYDCNLDPNHTKRFYKKMEEFSVSDLPIDRQVHIHSRIATEAEYVYSCPNCENRWYLKRELCYPIYCGLCYDRDGVEHYASLRKNSG